MRRIIVLFLVFFLGINLSFSFDILSKTTNLPQTYFSINEPDVILKTNVNVSNFTVEYVLSSNNYSQNLDLLDCGGDVMCSNFSLLDIISNSSVVFSGLIEFKVNVSNDVKVIYLDFDKPTFSLENYSVDKEELKLKLNYSVLDNSNKFRSFRLYKKVGGVEEFIADLNGTSYFEIDVVRPENLTLVFKVEDEAANRLVVEKVIEVYDVFKPKINSYLISVDKNGDVIFEFNISDEDLLRYELVQGDLKIVENVVGKSFSKKLSLPFENKEFKIFVYDRSLNNVSEIVNLDKSIVGDFSKRYFNEKVYQFNLDANSCVLNRLNGAVLSKSFEKTSNQFKVYFDSLVEGENVVSFVCEKDHYRQEFEKSFVYDIQSPSKVNLSVRIDDENFVYLNWQKAVDNSNDSLVYRIFKNGEEFAKSSNFKIKDVLVYPQSATYYLEISDLAGNSVKSDFVKVNAKKLDVTFKTNLDKNHYSVYDKSFKVSIESDLGSVVRVKIKNESSVFFNESYDLNVSNVLDLSLNLKKGKNYILVEVEDEVGNRKVQNYVVEVKDKPLVKKQEVILKNTKKVEKNNESNLTGEVKEKDLVNEESLSYVWLFLVILLLILIAVLFLFYEDKINRKILFLRKRRQKHDLKVKHREDIFLSRFVDDVHKRRRSAKQRDLNKSKSRKKNLTDFEKRKLDDLKISPKRDIDFSKKKKVIKRGVSDNTDIFLKPREKKKKMSVFDKFFKKKTEELDEFTAYINKRRSAKSWSSTREYLLKTKLEAEEAKRRKEEEKQKEKEEKLKEEMRKEEEKRKKLLEKQKKQEEKLREKEQRRLAREGLDDYLKDKVKKRKWFFVEKEVERDLKRSFNK